ncbi:TPA: lytic polysaccharide monooxygenase [Serratia odorifera]|nr:lytic polysaccharide monooxygenase [Serratia odorifera]
MFFSKNKVLSVVIASIGATSIIGPAFGHGALESPKARHYECKSQGNHWNPGAMKSAACKAALENSPAKQAAFDGWNGYTGFAPAPHGLAEAKRGVPDGMLCTGKHPEYAGFNQPRTDWTSTTLTPDSNGNVKMTYYYTATHSPSFIEFYINKKSVDPTKKALGWDDVELLKRFDITAGDLSVRHTINVTIPADRTGKAIIFTRWQRIDPAGEGFYGCSDVNIKPRTGIENPGGDEGHEEEDGAQIGWFDKGSFITAAHIPAIGEQVRFRLMGGTRGDNIVDESVTINAQNAENSAWVVELADKINRTHGNLVQIGQLQPDETISFNQQQPRQNNVFVNDKRHGYAIEIVKNITVPVVTLDRYMIDPISTISANYSYKITGSSDKNVVKWQWTRVAGDERIYASVVDKPVTNIVIPAGVGGGANATFELTGTNQKGEHGKATLKVNVLAPSVSLTGPSSISAEQSAKYNAKANFDYNQGIVSYDWKLAKDGAEISNGISQDGVVKSGLAAGDYQITVSARLNNGERSANNSRILKVTANNNNPGDEGTSAHKPWISGNTYVAGNTVTWKGINYQARNWTQAEPGKGQDWKLYDNAKPVNWQSTMVYESGNAVIYEGKVYVATQWAPQNTVPGKSSIWKLK